MNNTNDFFTIFIFPFKYEMEGKLLGPDEVAEKLSNGNTDCGKGWAVAYYALDTIDNYNEFYYFHPNVQRALFNKKGNEKKSEKENKGMQFLKREDFKKLEVEYYDKDNNKDTMTTKINEIDIHLFDNQIGLLTITTEKQEGDNKTDFQTFLRYNDIARRVYPPYLGDKNTCSLKLVSKILPMKITLFKDNDSNNPIFEGFNPIDLKAEEDKDKGKDKDKAEKDIIFLSKIIKELLTPFDLKDKKDMEMDKGKIYYTPFIDDRMFIVSYYSDDEVSDELKNRYCDGYVYETSKDWYRYIFVDGGDAGIANNSMKQELITKHTYTRWADYGTFYGMSRYSLVFLCNRDPYWSKKFKQDMKSMYYQMALIVLFQRAMLLKFAEDIDELTRGFETGKCSTKLKIDSDRRHGDFIRFINKYWFIEVTPQEQGIEIYNQWMGLLHLEKLYNEVQREVSELAEYVENKIEAETNKRLALITYFGFPSAILGLILGFWAIYTDKIKEAKTFIELFAKAFSVPSFQYLFIVSSISVFIVILVMLWRSFYKLSLKMISWFKDKIFQMCSHKGQK
jgi:hypothetical protein